MTSNMMIQHLFNALMLGSLYGLIAIGYTMVYGILRLINFAHGDIFMISTYFVFVAIAMLNMPWIPAVILSIAATAVFGFMIDRIAYRPLRSAPRISALISAIGVSFFIENLCLVIFTGVPKPMPRFEPLVKVIALGDVRILRSSSSFLSFRSYSSARFCGCSTARSRGSPCAPFRATLRRRG